MEYLLGFLLDLFLSGLIQLFPEVLNDPQRRSGCLLILAILALPAIVAACIAWLALKL